MIFDSEGLPKDNGATDFMDSARLAGLMAVFSIPNAPQLRKYIRSDWLAVRHPTEGLREGEMPSNNPLNFTRDQLICLSAGLCYQGYQLEAKMLLREAEARGNRAQNTEADYPGTKKKFPNGADFLSPSHMSHLRRCAGFEPTFIGNLWLKMDIIFNGLFSKNDTEQNQLMCMCLIAGRPYVQMYKKWNKKWDLQTQLYWSGWRNEPEVAKQIINYIFVD
jgi:hypothetical protein